MDLVLWILGGWFGVSVALAFPVAALIRHGRGTQEIVPLAMRCAAVSRPDLGAPHR